jgi:hypothetical protein
MKRKLLFFTLILVITSCTSTKKAMDSWLGASKQQLFMKWGPPTKTASDGGSGEILVYSTQGYNPGIPGYGVAPTAYWDNKYFYVNSEGKIYYWMTKREQIPPQQIDLNIYRRY